MAEKPNSPPKPAGVRARVNEDVDLAKMYKAQSANRKPAPAKAAVK